jgi:hypothetical protein
MLRKDKAANSLPPFRLLMSLLKTKTVEGNFNLSKVLPPHFTSKKKVLGVDFYGFLNYLKVLIRAM